MANALDDKIRELIGIAASIAGGCEPCLKYHYNAAKKAGCSPEQMKEAVEIAKMVRQAPMNAVDELASKLLGK
jgi:AhpD family alkylhydroperoxidase